MKNTQTKTFLIKSTKSGRFLGFFNVSDNLSSDDYSQVESAFQDAFTSSLKTKSAIELEVKDYKATGGEKSGIL
jgi:hypothetical protein